MRAKDEGAGGGESGDGVVVGRVVREVAHKRADREGEVKVEESFAEALSRDDEAFVGALKEEMLRVVAGVAAAASRTERGDFVDAAVDVRVEAAAGEAEASAVARERLAVNLKVERDGDRRIAELLVVWAGDSSFGERPLAGEAVETAR